MPDFTNCVGCEQNLCLNDGAYFTTCLTCFSCICFSCLEQQKIITLPPMRDKFGRIINDLYYPEESWFNKPYQYIHEESDDEEILEAFDKFKEPGFLGPDGCPYCDKIESMELLNWLIEKSGKTKQELENEFKLEKNK